MKLTPPVLDGICAPAPPGRTPARIEAVEEELGIRPPDDLRTLYQWRDGKGDPDYPLLLSITREMDIPVALTPFDMACEAFRRDVCWYHDTGRWYQGPVAGNPPPIGTGYLGADFGDEPVPLDYKTAQPGTPGPWNVFAFLKVELEDVFFYGRMGPQPEHEVRVLWREAVWEDMDDYDSMTHRSIELFPSIRAMMDIMTRACDAGLLYVEDGTLREIEDQSAFESVKTDYVASLPVDDPLRPRAETWLKRVQENDWPLDTEATLVVRAYPDETKPSR